MSAKIKKLKTNSLIILNYLNIAYIHKNPKIIKLTKFGNMNFI